MRSSDELASLYLVEEYGIGIRNNCSHTGRCREFERKIVQNLAGNRKNEGIYTKNRTKHLQVAYRWGDLYEKTYKMRAWQDGARGDVRKIVQIGRFTCLVGKNRNRLRLRPYLQHAIYEQHRLESDPVILVLHMVVDF